MTENQCCPVQKYQQQDQIEEKKNNHESVLSILLNVPAHTKTKQKKTETENTEFFSLLNFFFKSKSHTRILRKITKQIEKCEKKIQSIAQSIFEI